MDRDTLLGEVQYGMKGETPYVELVVPHGTPLLDLLKTQEVISKEVLSKIMQRGCLACISGAHFSIRERLENVILVDLTAGKLLNVDPTEP